MAQFFLSKKAIDDIYNSEGSLHRILECQKVIYVDLNDEELDAILLSDDNDEFQEGISSYNHNGSVKSGSSVIEKIKQGKYNELLSYDSPVLILGIDKNTAAKIQVANGVICISDQEDYNSLLQSHCSVYTEKPATKDEAQEGYNSLNEKSSEHNWNNILLGLNNLPCNTIIVNDHYLFKDDNVSDDHGYVAPNELSNIKQIFSYLLPPKIQDDVMHILFVHNMEDNEGKGDTLDWKHTADRVKKAISNLRDYRMVFEFLSGNHNCNLFSETHNRNIVTNYMILSAEHKLAAFAPDGSACVDQKISWYMLYGDGIDNSSDTPEHGRRIFINRIRNIVKYGIDHETSGYNFSQNGISNPNKINLKDIKNRAIRQKL